MFSAELLSVIKFFVSGGELPAVRNWDSVINELRAQAILSILLPIKKHIGLPDNVEKQINTELYQHLSHYIAVMHAQQELINALESQSVEPVVLKGAAAAQYYDFPESRTFGDVDLLISGKEEFNSAIQEILKRGYLPMEDYGEMSYQNSLAESTRHYEFKKSGVEVELHSRYAETDSPIELFLAGREPVVREIGAWHFPCFSDLENGLTLLQHVKHHLRQGEAGLRLILDWAFYLKKVLTDEFWEHDFERYAEEFGYKKLAICMTRICEIYFGTEHRRFTEEADDLLCNKVMQLIYGSGNFGRKKSEIRRKATRTNRREIMRRLRMRGVKESKAIQNHSVLKPLAWTYGAFLYAREVLKNKNGAIEMIKGQRYNKTFEEIKCALEIM